jgi:hypothetical protein
MTLLEQLEQELDRVGKQLHRLNRERTVLKEQITRLRTGERPEIVLATLEATFGVRLDIHLLAGQGGDAQPPEPPPDPFSSHHAQRDKGDSPW